MLTQREVELLAGKATASDAEEAKLFDALRTKLSAGIAASDIPRVYVFLTKLLQARRLRLKAERIQAALDAGGLSQKEEELLRQKLMTVNEERKKLLAEVVL